MLHWGVGIEVVASEIGALGRERLKVSEAELVDRVCRRVGCTLRWRVTNAINTGIELGVFRRVHENGVPFISIVA